MTPARFCYRALAAIALAGALLPATPAAAGKSSTSDATTTAPSLTEVWNDLVVTYLPGGDIDPTNLPVLAGDFVSLTASIAPADAPRLRLADAQKLASGKGVVVAILDGGFNLAHPAVSSRWTSARYDAFSGDGDPQDLGNKVDDDADGVTDGGVGHGTFVASLVARCAPSANLMPVRIADDEGRGTMASFGSGVQFAVDNGAKVINVSFALNYQESIVSYWLNYAESKGAVIVGAAGNEGTDLCTVIAKCPTVLAVGAVNARDWRASFSNFGTYVDLYAPGVDTLAAYGVPTSKTIAYWSGTSFSAAFVSGAAALVRQRHPTWGPPAVRDVLRTSVDAAYDTTGARLPQGRINHFLAASR